MEANIAIPAALIADPARASILMALLDGRAHPAGRTPRRRNGGLPLPSNSSLSFTGLTLCG